MLPLNSNRTPITLDSVVLNCINSIRLGADEVTTPAKLALKQH